MSKFIFRFRKAVACIYGPESPTTRHVLLTLSIHMNADGSNCWPSFKTLARETGLSERTICTHLEIAENGGWFKKKKRGVPGKGWKLNVYLPLIPNKALKEVQRLEQKGTESDAEGTEPHAEGTEPDDNKALKEVQSRSSVRSSYRSSGRSSSSEQNFDSEQKAILSIPLKHKNKNTGGSELFPIYQSNIDEWSESFPAVDVLQEFKKLREWNISNPKKRKTQRGIRKHITAWLSRAQDKHFSNKGQNPHSGIMIAGQEWMDDTNQDF